jgi:hypothetical protein
MPYENSAGLQVNNFYGPRGSGGTKGVIKTEGYQNEYAHNLKIAGLPFKFDIKPGGVYVTKVDISFATGPVTAYTIGGVNVFAATEAAPVFLAANNTGVIAQTGGTAGVIVVKYKNVAGA